MSSRRLLVALAAVAVAIAGFATGGTTYAAWSDFVVIEGNHVGAGVWETPFAAYLPSECAGTLEGYQLLVGTEGDDVLTGTNGDDLIFGLGGNDTIDGGNGKDCLVGGDGDDGIRGGNGKDVLIGGLGVDSLGAGEAPDSMGKSKENGKDALYGDEDDDLLKGGNGPDLLDGGDGVDFCDGGHAPEDAVSCEEGSAGAAVSGTPPTSIVEETETEGATGDPSPAPEEGGDLGEGGMDLTGSGEGSDGGDGGEADATGATIVGEAPVPPTGGDEAECAYTDTCQDEA